MDKVLMLLAFIASGMLGILLHCFIEMGKINKQLNGEFKLQPYLKLERFNIYASVTAVIIAAICVPFLKKLMGAEYLLCPAFTTIGYFGQSVVIAAFGKAADCVKAITGRDIEEPKIILRKDTVA